MSHSPKDEMLDHETDGIREYDNPSPKWLVYIFYASILFSAGYWLVHVFGPGILVSREYAEDVAKAEALRAKLEPPVKIDEATLAAALKDASQVGSGRGLFDGRCASCHGDRGQGLVGPNLTDDYWLHGGGTLEGIYKVVRDGVPEKGMVPWGKALKPQQMKQVTAFVASLHGTSPPNPKAPEGNKIAKVSWR